MSIGKNKKNLKKLNVLLSLLLFFGLALAGCPPASEERSNQALELSGSNPPEMVEKARASRSIQHAMGTTQIAETPERVITLTNEATDIVLALGVKPIGAIKSWSGDPYYDYIEEELSGVPVVGDQSQPNLEKITSLKPDLIIGSKVRHEQVYQLLSRIAPTVVSETYGMNWKENLKLYAEALNKAEKGEKLLANWNQRLANFQAKMGNQLSQKVSLVRFMPGTARIYYNDSFPGQIVKEAGLQRPQSQDREGNHSDITFEQIFQVDGDVLFYFTAEKGDGDATEIEQEWLNHPLWKKLEVVKNNQVYQVSDVHWNAAQGVQAADLALDDLYKYLLDEKQATLPFSTESRYYQVAR